MFSIFIQVEDIKNNGLMASIREGVYLAVRSKYKLMVQMMVMEDWNVIQTVYNNNVQAFGPVHPFYHLLFVIDSNKYFRDFLANLSA